MAEERRFAQRWEEYQQYWDKYRPSKPLWFWSCIGTALLTIIIGFTAGGWVTGGAAREMTQQAADGARAELVANACVKNFISSPNFESRFSAFNEASARQRSTILQERGWVTLAGMDKPLAAAASICAGELAKIQPLLMSPPESAGDSSS